MSTFDKGTQVVTTIFSAPQQFTVTYVSSSCEVYAQSNVQPLSMILAPGEYRSGVTLVKFGRRRAI